MDTDPVLTIPEVAEDLRVSKSHAAKLLRGEVEGVKPIPHLSAGRRKLVPRSALERWKRENLSGMLSDHSEKNTVTHFERRRNA
jgi:excisionase family DNA binding protein